MEGRALIVLTYQREFVKGYWRKKQWELPVHAFYDIYREDMPLFLNFLAFFLPMASADGVFRDFTSLTEILDLADDLAKNCPSQNGVLETIYFKESAFKTPVFRQFTELAIEKTTGKARGADSFGKALVELGHRSGYLRNITIRASRRWVLMEAGMILASQTLRDLTAN